MNLNFEMLHVFSRGIIANKLAPSRHGNATVFLLENGRMAFLQKEISGTKPSLLSSL
jgi:hypothetical protein